MNTSSRSLGKVKMVAKANCQSDTESIEANKELEYAHGGKGEIRIRTISGKPLARTTSSNACHFALVLDHFRSRAPKRVRRITKTSTEPTRLAVEAMKKPLSP